MNKIIIALIFVALLVMGGVFYTLNQNKQTAEYEAETDEVMVDTDIEPVEEVGPTDMEDVMEADDNGPQSVIGQSVSGKDIVAYHFGEGDKEVLFVGGIHGGYSWNTALVAYELVAYLEGNESSIPEGLKVTVIPSLNPDGLAEVTGKDGVFRSSDVSATEAERVAARFNANDVDLNRNFDCEWQSTGTWQDRSVSGGSAPFSEPESKAIRDYVDSHDIAGAVVWYSAAGGVYASQCNNGTMAKTSELTNVYAQASGYGANEEFDFYEITGDMVNWLAKERIPAISVLLSDHEGTEWSKNKAGIEAVLKKIAE